MVIVGLAKVTPTRSTQPANAPTSMDARFFGKFMAPVSPEKENAFAPITFSESGKVTEKVTER
jgi:hypothetical protein